MFITYNYASQNENEARKQRFNFWKASIACFLSKQLSLESKKESQRSNQEQLDSFHRTLLFILFDSISVVIFCGFQVKF